MKTWRQEAVLGEYGWCLVIVRTEPEGIPPFLRVEFKSQAFAVTVGVSMNKTEALNAAEMLMHAIDGVYLGPTPLDPDDDCPMLSAGVADRGGIPVLTFRGEYDISGSIPFVDGESDEDMAAVANLLRAGAAELPEVEQ